MSDKVQTAVVILAAGSIKNKYRSFSFIYDSPALVPIASRSTISFILDFYERHSVHIYIAINAADADLFRKELAYYDKITLIPIQRSGGVCDTMTQALSIATEPDIIINLGTTIPTSFPADDVVCIDSAVSKNNYYSGIIEDASGIGFKTKKDNSDRAFFAFTGVFRTNKNVLLKSLSHLQKSNDLVEVVRDIHKTNALRFEKTDWIDTGHEINYADARKKLISSRSFNAITVDNHTGILTKKSTNTNKLAQEIKYVGMLPADLQIFYPRILSSGLGSVMMEYYGYPNLAEYQLYRDIEPLWWHRIFDSLGYCLKSMERYPFSIGPEAFRMFYLDKTLDRIESYLGSLPADDKFVSSPYLTINGRHCENLNVLKDKLIARINELYNEADFCVMHGDFCFNNILFDTVSNTIKLIDPRGSFGAQCVGIYGDRKYDLAKLLHSSVGHYDYIVNNLFQLSQQDNEVHYSFPLRDNATILETMSNSLLEKMSASKKDILFIVGLLFLSMCPLHADNPQRQRLMYAHGLFFVNEYI